MSYRWQCSGVHTITSKHVIMGHGCLWVTKSYVSQFYILGSARSRLQWKNTIMYPLCQFSTTTRQIHISLFVTNFMWISHYVIVLYSLQPFCKVQWDVYLYNGCIQHVQRSVTCVELMAHKSQWWSTSHIQWCFCCFAAMDSIGPLGSLLGSWLME